MNTNCQFSIDAKEAKTYDLSINVMDEDQIRSLAPRVFCKAPTNPGVSKRYTLASTETVINDMKTLGWDVVMASQPRRRSPNSISSYHMVVFQNKDIKITKTTADGETVVDCYPRIILTNSHDGFNSFKFMVGLYRVVCSNGLIIATQTFSNIRIRHINYTFEELRSLVSQIVEMVPSQINILNNMQNVVLNINQKRELALAALRERRNDSLLEVPSYILDEILAPTRDEDQDDNLWTTFNIVQEKMMNGNFSMISRNGKIRHARQIKAIAKTISLNQAMFKAATSFLNQQ